MNFKVRNFILVLAAIIAAISVGIFIVADSAEDSAKRIAIDLAAQRSVCYLDPVEPVKDAKEPIRALKFNVYEHQGGQLKGSFVIFPEHQHFQQFLTIRSPRLYRLGYSDPPRITFSFECLAQGTT